LQIHPQIHTLKHKQFGIEPNSKEFFMTKILERPVYRSNMDTIQYRPGAIVLYPGRAEMIYRVKSGLIRLHTMDNEGNSLTLRYIKPSHFFGEEALAGLERQHFAESVTESSIEMFHLHLITPEIALSLTTCLAQALNQSYVTISRLATKRLRARIAASLIEMSETALGSITPEGHRQVYATHDELAASVGSVRETVTKVIGELSREGAIDSGYGKVILRDYEGLCSIAME
jgi:CRP/FNR family transcriptional regulator, cyclic AMP receptor protein